MIVVLEIQSSRCAAIWGYVNLPLMNDIFFAHLPAAGDELVLETWSFDGLTLSKEPIGTVKVTAVERRTKPEWNPVLKRLQNAASTLVTLEWNGKLYVRRCLIGGRAVATGS